MKYGVKLSEVVKAEESVFRNSLKRVNSIDLGDMVHVPYKQEKLSRS